jgi:hypothetical protein
MSDAERTVAGHDRDGGSNDRLPVLIRMDRRVLTALLVGVVFLGFVLCVTLVDPAFVVHLESADTIDTMFSSMITVIVTGTTLVVSIAQLVLSQEDGPLGDQRNRMSDTMDFREFTAELLDGPTPAEPSALLRGLLRETADRAETLRASSAARHDRQVRSEIEDVTGGVVASAEAVAAELDGSEFGTFDVLSAALHFDYSRKIVRLEGIAADHAAQFDEADRRLIDELKTSLSMFAPAREHVKTLYFQWELIEFSQWTLYTAVPALVVAGVMLGVVDAGTVPGRTAGVANVVWLVGGAFAATLTPFLLFVSYLLRILTVAKQTLAIGPLILRQS